MTPKRYREYIQEAERLGAEATSLEQTRNQHYWLTLTFRGKTKTFLIGGTDSDRRALMNCRARIKRWIMEVSDEQENGIGPDAEHDELRGVAEGGSLARRDAVGHSRSGKHSHRA